MADVQYADVIRTVNGLLKQRYPEITRYGNDTVDKAVTPYFLWNVFRPEWTGRQKTCCTRAVLF